MGTFVAVWLLNSVAAQGVATGAFEITLDGELAFSKLATGHLPSADDVVDGLEKLGLVKPE